MSLVNFLDAVKTNSNMKLVFALLMSLFLSACGAGAGADVEEVINNISNVDSQTSADEDELLPVEVAAVQILSQPQGLKVSAGESAIFSISASGGGALSFQWRKGEQNIPGATGNSLVLTDVSEADAALYDVIVSNSAGSQYSLAALLTVNAPVVIVPTIDPVLITSQPQAIVVNENASASFSVQVTGGGTITYQWLKDGQAINGATASSLNLSSVTLSDSANYSVMISNSEVPVFSDAVSLSVTVVQVASSIELSWDIPQEREDGSDLSLGEINGYVIAYGTDENNLSNELSIEGASVTSKVLENLNAGMYYFSIATVDSDGVKGSYSSVINQSI